MDKTTKRILHIAVPSIISNITVPLLGLVDITIAGHLGNVSYIGAIAIGSMLFNMIYWLFGFLRMGTGGMTSQAFGRHDLPEVTRLLMRSIFIGLLLSLFLILLQMPLRFISFHFIDASPEVEQMASLYFRICIWGAPATLGLYSFNGWFIGMQNSRFPMFIAIVQNLINIFASATFVFLFGMKVEGIALGTLTAQYAGFFMAIFLWIRYYGSLHKYLRREHLFERHAMLQFFQVNRDIFLRTLCLISVTVFFTSTGASYGDITLAVNTLLMQLFTLFSYIMDGFAYAGEALTGRLIGARNFRELQHTIFRLFYWGIISSLLFTLLYGTGGTDFLSLLTDDRTVIDASKQYFFWVLAIPFISFSAFLFDGICIGSTKTDIMLYSMATATICFFLTYFCLHDALQNHALWLAFILYLGIRGITQALLLRKHKLIPIFAYKHF